MKIKKRDFIIIHDYVKLIENLSKRMDEDTSRLAELKQNLDDIVYTHLDHEYHGVNYKLDLQNKTVEIVPHNLMLNSDVLEV